jgi:hypothetical protein
MTSSIDREGRQATRHISQCTPKLRRHHEIVGHKVAIILAELCPVALFSQSQNQVFVFVSKAVLALINTR